MPHQKKLTTEDEDYIRNNYLTITIKTFTVELGVSAPVIRKFMDENNLPRITKNTLKKNNFKPEKTVERPAAVYSNRQYVNSYGE
jgi:hypothetical protein